MADDDFFRQLQQGTLDAPATEERPRRRGPVAASGNGHHDGVSVGQADGEHPITRPLNGTPRPAKARLPRPAPTPQRARRERLPALRSRRPSPEGMPAITRRRAAALGLLALAALAVVVMTTGGDPSSVKGTAKARLTVHWRGVKDNALRVRWRPGATATLLGWLRGGDGDPLANARVSVLAADASQPGQGKRTVGEVRTDRRGRLRTEIAADRGAPRKALSFSYLAAPQDTVPAALGQATLSVYAPVSISASASELARGKALALRGRTVGGAPVILAIAAPGSDKGRRLPDRARAGRDGRWKAIVRITPSNPAGKYRFQARTPRNSQLGYLGATSRPVTVNAR